MKVEVVIPTYNRRTLLERAVQSVLGQGVEGIRISVYNNASTDGTREYLDALAASDGRVKVLHRETNVGALNNYADALQRVSEDCFVPLADDDYLEPGFLATCLPRLIEHPQVGAVATATKMVNGEGTFFGHYPNGCERWPEGLLQPAEHLPLILRDGHWSWSSVLWRRSVLDLVGPPYFHAGPPSDVDFQIQIFARAPVWFVKIYGASFLSHAAQTSAQANPQAAHDWAHLARRLDAAVLGGQVLPQEQYVALRSSFLRRYRGEWRSRYDRQTSVADRLAWAHACAFDLQDTPEALRIYQEILADVGLTHWAAWPAMASAAAAQLGSHAAPLHRLLTLQDQFS